MKRDLGVGQRLAEERKRLGLKQAEFAQRLGIEPGKQSLLETGNRDLRAGYLALLPNLGIDVLYVLTGKRSTATALPEEQARLMAEFLALPPPARAVLVRVAQDLVPLFQPRLKKAPKVTNLRRQ